MGQVRKVAVFGRFARFKPTATPGPASPAADSAAQARHAFAEHQLQDGLVAIERTGRYHRLAQRSFAAAKDV